MVGHYRHANEAPFQWRFNGGPMMARYSGISILSPSHQLKKMLSVLDPVLQSFLDPRMCLINMFGSIIHVWYVSSAVG